MKILFSLVLFVAFVSSAQARLGETHEQVAARFGQGVSSPVVPNNASLAGLEQRHFEKQAFLIDVVFTDVSVGETYTITSGQLAESQIETLLTSESEGHQWKEEAPWQRNRYWIRDDGAKAELTQNNQFIFRSKFLVDRDAAWHKAWDKEHTPSVEGF